ncbi:hypothetical protein VTK56DRAFT_5036 [Thermocarpiscus australiensis]
MPGDNENWQANWQSGRDHLVAPQRSNVASAPVAGQVCLPGATSPLTPTHNDNIPPSAPALRTEKSPAVDSRPTTVTADEPATPAEQQQQHPFPVYNHGTWTAADDRTLLLARSRGQHWADLQRIYFPAKTANACRKRYERLVERRGLHDYSARRFERVAHEYTAVRREMWSKLAERVGMEWEVVEALCMSAGLKAIQSHARSYANRMRREHRIAQRAREGQASAASVGLLGLVPPDLRQASGGFGTTYGGHGAQGPNNGQRNLPGLAAGNSGGLMRPPLFTPTRGDPFRNALPPVPQVFSGGYFNSKPRPTGGLPCSGGPPSEPQSSSGAPDWLGTNGRGPP